MPFPDDATCLKNLFDVRYAQSKWCRLANRPVYSCGKCGCHYTLLLALFLKAQEHRYNYGYLLYTYSQKLEALYLVKNCKDNSKTFTLSGGMNTSLEPL